MSEDEKKPILPLTMDELLGASAAHIDRTITIEMDDGKILERKVTFRRLTYKEIADLSKIPRENDAAYTSTVVFWASLVPKFEVVDDVSKAPHGFVRHYGTLILDESGKDPFLSKR